MHKLFYIIAIFLLISVSVCSQNKVEIRGMVVSEENQKLELVNVSVKDEPGGAITSNDGTFKLKVSSSGNVTLIFSRIGFETKELKVTPGNFEEDIKVVLKKKQESIAEVEVAAKEETNQNFTKIDSKLSANLPDASGGSIEALVKTQMGVTSNNEMSSQYRVRGGNFDENLVYVNDIEVYRPFLVRAGQQEGLSFINPELVSDIRFSAGGFDARYGDKMSSVLDIKYKRPTDFGGSASASLLGTNAHLEGTAANGKFSHITGLRYKTNKYLLGTMDVSGDYQPNFLDVQSYMTYRLNNKWRLGFLGNISRNRYDFEPVDRETTFGTISEVQTLRVYFEGQEEDLFMTGFGAVSLDFSPNNNNNYKLVASGYRTSEDETYDILGQYWLQELGAEGESGNIVFEKGTGIGVGSYLEHARNYLYGAISNLALRGAHRIGNNNLEWEIKYQHERFSDIINEWEMRDSADYNIPLNEEKLELSYAYNDENEIESNRFTFFVQENRLFELSNGSLNLALGLRGNYWDFNQEFLLSPRISMLYTPDWERDFSFKLAGGIYYQSPFYKEYRIPGGGINYDIKAQKSIHLVAGFDYYFQAWQRPFKFSTELYYKKMDHLNPYQIDNVRIRYSAKNNAEGYAAGLDMKVNGEFVKGVESWASLSIMQTEENLKDDVFATGSGQTGSPGYIPRPSDQRLNFSLMFQDYLRNNPSFKVNLNLMFGSGLPFGPPNSERYQAVHRMPSYRRVDIGFAKELTGSQLHPERKTGAFKNIWLGLEIFNLFDINNTISYFWVTDVNSREYAVPNYLTSRRLNVKLVTRF